MSFPWPYVNPDDVFPSEVEQRCPHLPEGMKTIVYMYDTVDSRFNDEVKDEIVKGLIEQNLAFPHQQVTFDEKDIHLCAYHPVRAKVFWVVGLR